MKYYGIKTPENNDEPNYIWWIANSEHECWNLFFSFPNKYGELMPYKLDLYTAIQAYKAIGYQCVELEVIEKQSPQSLET